MLAVHLLRGLGVKAEAGGNIGRPPWDLSDEPDPDYWVIETSSFQVPDLPVASRVVAVTSLAPGPPRLARDGGALLRRQALALHETGRRAGAGQRIRRTAARRGSLAWVAHVRWVTDADGERRRGVVGRTRPAGHDTTRATPPWPARSCWPSRFPGADDDQTARPGGRRVRRAAQPVPVGGHRRSGRVRRRQPVDQRPPDRGRSRRLRPGRPVALLVGGHDRGVDYAPLGRAVAGRTSPTLVVTMPDNGPRIGAAVRAEAASAEVVDAGSLEEAVATAYRWALRAWRTTGATTGTDREGERGGAAVSCCPELRSLQRLPGAGRRLRRRRRPLRPPRKRRLISSRRRAGRQLFALAEEEPPRVGRHGRGGLHDVGVGPQLGQGLDRPVGVLGSPGCGARPRSWWPPRRARSGAPARRTWRPRCPRPGPRRRPPWPERAPDRSRPPCAPGPATPPSTAWPGRRPPRRPRGQRTRRARCAARACRVRRPGWPRRDRGPGPGGRAEAMASRVTGSSRSICRYCSA